MPLGEVPQEWHSSRVVGQAALSGDYAEICHTEWLAAIDIRPLTTWLDASALQQPQRALTQPVSRLVYEDAARYSGIHYLSRLGHDINNWAIYDRAAVTGSEQPIALNDPDLANALNLLRLRWTTA